MKTSSILFALILSCSVTFAQDTDQSLKGASTWIEQPDIVIKADELKNFPGGQLMEMLLGRLPGLDQIKTSNQESKVVFIVDGVVWWDIDALNINNIEEIAHYRGGLTSKLGLQNVSAGGVILITTKTGAFNQPLNATVNTIVGNNTFKNTEENKRSTLQSYNVILNQGLENFSWRTSAVFNKSLNNMNEHDFNRRFQFNADIRFKPLDWLELEANANYAPGKGDFSFNRASPYFDINTQEKQKNKNWNGLFVARIQPIKGLTNEVKLLKNKVSKDINSFNQSTSIGSEIYTHTTSDSRDQYSEINHSTLINDLNYRFNVDQDRVKFNVGALYQYDRVKYNYDYSYITHTDIPGYDPIGQPSSWSKGKGAHDFTVQSILADLSINLYDVLALNAGIRRDKIKNDTITHDNPFYHVNLNLKKVLLNGVKGISKIDLFYSFGKNNTVADNLSPNPENNPNISPELPGDMYLKHLAPDQLKGTSQNYGVRSSFLNNRLHISGDWYNNNSHTYLYLSIPSSSPYLTTRKLAVSLKETSWRIWTSADILKNTAVKWNTGLNIYKNHAKIITESFVLINSPLSDQFKPAIQTGMQQQFSYAGFILNLNGYGYFNHPEWEIDKKNPYVETKFTKSTLINLNYAYLGYDFKKYLEKSSFKSLNIGIVSRNELYHAKGLDLIPSRTIGIALNATL